MTIKTMKKFKELQELRSWYWERLAEELWEEARKELHTKLGEKSWFGKHFLCPSDEDIKELQTKKFEVIFNKMLKSKGGTLP